MSAGDELFAKSLFSSPEIREEVDSYLVLMFKQMLKTCLIRNPVRVDANIGQLPFTEESLMLKNFVTEYTQGLLVKAVKEEVLKVYMKEELHELIQRQVERCVADNLKAFETAFKKNKTIPKGVRK
jgi:hypothetical protein